MSVYQVNDRVELVLSAPAELPKHYAVTTLKDRDILKILKIGVGLFGHPSYTVLHEPTGKEIPDLMQHWVNHFSKLIVPPPQPKTPPVYCWQWPSNHNSDKGFKGSVTLPWDDDWDG